MKNKTDWDSYYAKPFRTSKYTRRYTARKLIGSIATFAENPQNILELGGANSCFFVDLWEKFRPKHYHIVDNNERGLSAFRARIGELEGVQLSQADLLDPSALGTFRESFDVVFSTGLIEHFSPAETAQIIRKHFDCTKVGGLVIMTYPTSTWLYKLTRKFAELLKIWIFHDERPLSSPEVVNAIHSNQQLLLRETLWPLVLTQELMVFRKQ